MTSSLAATMPREDRGPNGRDRAFWTEAGDLVDIAVGAGRPAWAYVVADREVDQANAASARPNSASAEHLDRSPSSRSRPAWPVTPVPIGPLRRAADRVLNRSPSKRPTSRAAVRGLPQSASMDGLHRNREVARATPSARLGACTARDAAELAPAGSRPVGKPGGRSG